MRTLTLPDGFPLEGMVTSVADDDAMFDGRDDHYVKVCLSADHNIQRALQGMPAPQRILDLPSGHGRITRILRARYPMSHITVCDLDRSGVDFAAKEFGARGIYSQEDFRDLELGEAFDLIWVGSLITHLSERQTRRFLDFAVRHLAPDGTLVMTSHGSFVAHRLLSWRYGLTDSAVRGLLADTWMEGYGYRSYPGSEGYGISLIRRAWFEDLFAEGPLQLEEYKEQAWDEHQDVLVVRRRRTVEAHSPGFLQRLRHAFAKPELPQPLFDAGSWAPLPMAKQAQVDELEVTGFDEAWYLASDDAVRTAVAEGVYESGLDHYRKFGWLEARPFCDPAAAYDARPRRTDKGRGHLSTAKL